MSNPNREIPPVTRCVDSIDDVIGRNAEANARGLIEVKINFSS